MSVRLPVHNEGKQQPRVTKAGHVIVSVVMPPEMKRALCDLAASQGRSVSSQLRVILANVLVADGAGSSLLAPAPGDQVVNWFDELLEATGEG